MQHITGQARNQMFFSSLDDTILPDNLIRFIGAFANSIDSAIIFGTTGKKPRAKGKMGLDWVLIKTMLMLGVVLEKANGQ